MAGGAARHGGLIREYLGNAIKPTVAFPYALLLLLSLLYQYGP